MEAVVLFMVMQMPFNTPILMRDQKQYMTHKECQEVGQVKARETAEELAENIGAPIRFSYWCEGEERTET